MSKEKTKAELKRELSYYKTILKDQDRQHESYYSKSCKLTGELHKEIDKLKEELKKTKESIA